MKDLPDFSLFLEKNYGLRLLRSAFTVESNELVFKLQTVDNQWFGLKIYRSAGAPSAEKLAEIWLYVAYLAKRGIAVQKPVLSLENRLVTAFFFEKKTCAAVLFRWLEGKKLTRWATVPTATKWGELLGKLHLAATEWEAPPIGPDGWTKLDRLETNFVEQTAAWLPAVLPSHGFSEKEAARFRKKLDELWVAAVHFSPATGCFGHIHSDLHPGNLLRTGRNLTAIDWDDLAFGQYLLDIAVVFNEIRRFPDEKSVPLRAAFLDGYRSKFDLPDDFPRRFAACLDLANLMFAAWVFHPENGFARTKKLVKWGKTAVGEILHRPKRTVIIWQKKAIKY